MWSKRFLARFCCPEKSRKRLCCKGFRALAVSIVDEIHNAPKAGALPTALHPVIQFFIRLGVFSQTYTYTRTCIRGEYGLGIILTHIILPIYTVKSSGFRCAPLFLFLAADLHARQRYGEHEPKDAHDPRIVPQVIRQAAHHGAAHGRAGGAGKGPGGGVAAMASSMGGSLDVPQHGTDEPHDAEQSRLDPHLQVEVMGVDEGRFPMVEVHILDERLGGGGAEARAGNR